MFDPNALDAALSDPALSGLTDQQAADALSAPVLTPRSGRVTVTTLAAADCWGFAKAAAALAAFEQVAAAGGSNGAAARALLSILQGPGFDASDPQAAQMAPTFVGLSGGAITSDDARAALYLPPTYRAGGPVSAADVAASRHRLAFAARKMDLIRRGSDVWNQWVSAVTAAATDADLPAAATLPGGGA